MAPLRCAAKFDPFLSLDCARVEGVGRNPRKGRDQILPSGTHGTTMFLAQVSGSMGLDVGDRLQSGSRKMKYVVNGPLPGDHAFPSFRDFEVCFIDVFLIQLFDTGLIFIYPPQTDYRVTAFKVKSLLE